MRKLCGRRAAGGGAPKAPSARAMAAARAALLDVAREWRSEGVDPRDPVTRSILRPMLERKLSDAGYLPCYREAGVDPYDVLCGAFEALDGETA